MKYEFTQTSKGPAIAKKRDLFLLLGITVVLLGFVLWSYWIKPSYFPDEKLQYAWIYHENALLEHVPLDGSENTWELEVPGEDGEHVHIIISTNSDGTIQILESNCPDKVCVNTGRVYMEGQSIACLPNRVIIKIAPEEGSSGEGIDG